MESWSEWIGRNVGQYRIDGHLGRGGMGDVFKAWDSRLKRPVALKGLRVDKATRDSRHKRFVRETRLASRVSHPYVATVYDVVEEEDSIFLVMELIEGRSLGEALNDDEFLGARISELALEVAEALVAIHRAGLIHRDLKPSNVMVTDEGHVKVLDFGVARLMEGAEQDEEETQTALTKGGVVVGTPLYMSPEQLKGGSLDPRSDLFSLGVLLYEVISGKHPFVRESPAETTTAILRDPPWTGREVEPLDRGPLHDVVNRLMEKDPAQRYQSAEELVRDLRATVEGQRLSRATVTSARRVVRETASKTPWVAIASVVAVVAIVALVWSWLGDRSPTSSVPIRPLVAVVPFTDRTGEIGMAHGEMVADLLGAVLGESSAVRSLGADRLQEVIAARPGLKAAETAQWIADSTETRWVVFGQLFKQGDSYNARIDVYRPGVDDPVENLRVSAAGTSALVDLARPRLLEVFAPDGGAGAEIAARELTSVSDKAASLEFQAREKMRELRYSEAIDLLEEAVREDPTFVLAYARLADALDQAGYGTRAARAAAETERLAESGVGVISERTRLEAKAIHARISSDLDAVVELSRSLAERYPDEPRHHVRFAQALQQKGEHDAALSAIDTAIAVDREAGSAHLVRAHLLADLERPDEALVSLDRAEKLFDGLNARAGVGRVVMERATIAFRSSDYARAAELFKEADRIFIDEGRVVLSADAQRSLADTQLAMGNLTAAEESYRPALAVLNRAGHRNSAVYAMTGLGAQLYAQGDYTGATSRFREAVRAARDLDNDTLLARPLYNLASLLSFTGKVSDSLPLAEEVLEIARRTKNRRREVRSLRLIADNRYQLGQLDESIRSYRDLLQLQNNTNSSSEQLGTTQSWLAEVLEAKGATREALEAATTAIDLQRQAGDRVGVGYVLVRRARLLGATTDWDAAEQDLDEAARLVTEQESELQDLEGRILLARAMLAGWKGAWKEANDAALECLERFGSSDAVSLTVPALTVKADALIALGNRRAALADARTAAEHPRALPTERLAARILMARIAGENDPRRGSDLARAALSEAESMGLPLLMAGSAAASLEVSTSPPGSATIRATGIRTIQLYLDDAPDDWAASMKSRSDIARILSALNPGND